MSEPNSANKLKVAYVMNLPLRWLAFEWIAQNIDEDKIEISFIFLDGGSPPSAPFLEKMGVKTDRINYETDTRFFMGTLKVFPAIFKMYRLLKKNKIDVVHAHFRHAPVVGLIAARLAGVKGRVHTRHVGPVHNWPKRSKQTLFFRKFEYRFANRVVAISKLVKDALLKEGVSSKKISTLHHGFDIQKFQEIDSTVVDELKKKYNPEGNQPVIGVISRYVELKGIQYIIPAFHKLLEEYPNALLIVAGAFGPDEKMIRELMETIPAKNRCAIKFEEQVYALYQLFDVFVHAPIAPEVEAFGQVYIEAMAAGIPSVITRSGVALEYAVHQENAIVVDYRSSEQIYDGIKTLLTNGALREKLILNGKKIAEHSFTIQKMVRSLEKLYLESIQ